MDPWSAVHRAFAVETFLKNHNFVIPTQQIFRRHFSIGRHGRVPDRNTIKNWVQKFRTTASATDRKPEGRVRTVRTPETLKEHEPLSVVAPNNQHVDIQLPSTYRADRSDGYFIVVYIFTITNYTFCENCQTMILLEVVHFVNNLLP
jgi:hypothetical protein